MLTAIYLRIPIVFMMKKEMFWWPASLLWYRLGGFPIDRSQRKAIVPTMVQAFREYDRMVLVVTPEGTRSAVPHWKSGFYWIAVHAGVPIKLLWIGNKDRVAGMGPLFHPTGDIEADFAAIRAFYEQTLGQSMPNIVPPPGEEATGSHGG
jgi:1-acyl-sn-glycerol-3-phosphate acyltransferase